MSSGVVPSGQIKNPIVPPEKKYNSSKMSKEKLNKSYIIDSNIHPMLMPSWEYSINAKKKYILSSNPSTKSLLVEKESLQLPISWLTFNRNRKSKKIKGMNMNQKLDNYIAQDNWGLSKIRVMIRCLYLNLLLFPHKTSKNFLKIQKKSQKLPNRIH